MFDKMNKNDIYMDRKIILEENEEWMVYYHTNECMGLTILAKLTEEQYQDMKNHQEKAAQGANHRPDYKESNND